MAAFEGLSSMEQAEKIRNLLDHVGLSEQEIRDSFPQLNDGWEHLDQVALSSPEPAGAGPIALDVAVVRR